MEYYAHISDDGRRQTVAEHLTGTAVLCRAFAGAFGAEAEGELMGLAHDIGKCTDSFQKRLLEDAPLWTTPPPVRWPARSFCALVPPPV